ncbi:PREDICTED: phosphatidylinositol 4-kinase alpha 1-like [Nicotiana attenuata]|uniref:phosphatidylinositol 4-kinase alpha 1-like n=1 Tax=Nicotiana attenuata TaxID=49451 RepID=UPI000904EB30|nr:PREDICTED: phosphatidylinositol 4-kinase alpha 1-like [Nicotiana attenuata]
MDSMIELCDLIAENPAQLGEKLAWICGRCPPAEALGGSSPRVSVSRSQLNAILAVARFLSKCPNHSYETPKSIVLAFYRSIPSSFNRYFWPQSFTNDSIGSFFVDFFEYICIACKLCPEFSADVAIFTGDIMISAISNENEDLGIKKAILKAFCCNCPPVVPSDASKLVLGMLEQFPSSPGSSSDSSSTSPGSSSDSSSTSVGDGRSSADSGEVVEEAVDSIERREMALKVIGNVLDKSSIDNSLLENVRFIVQQQFRSMVAFLKKSKHDWSGQGQSLKVRINAKLSAYQAAARLQIKILGSLDLDGKSSKCLLRGALELLIGAAEACLCSAWRKLRACEELFNSLLSGISRAAVARDGQMLEFLLVRFKPLVLDTCAQSDTWDSNGGAMFESVLKTSCEIIQFGLYKNQFSVYTFITSILERNHYKEEVEKEKQAAPSLQLNFIRLLADLKFSIKRPEVVDVILPFFIESLEEGDASVPGLLRLRLLAAVARLASLGFEKSYHEAVVLMTRSYLSKLAAVGSTESKTTALEATTERIETLPTGFLLIAKSLTTPKLRTDYRHRLLSLCSDVGLAAESISGKCGADFLGPLLPAVAEICSDSDPTVDIEPSLLKLFRNLWFYVALFGLAPPLQDHHGMTKSVSTTLNSVGSTGAISLQAVSGPYMWSAVWFSAVQRISQGTPPLVVSSMKWLEDELELSALLKGSRRGGGNEKAAVSQRTAVSAALRGCMELSAMRAISGVKSTYLLAVACLEITRFSSNAGILNVGPSSTASRSAFSCVFEYLKIPGLTPAICQCLTAIVHSAFEKAVAWLEDRVSETRSRADYKESTLTTHVSFLVRSLSQRNEHIRDISVNLLNHLRDRFPQILWNSSCLDSVLFSVHNDLPSSAIDDFACIATIRSLYQRTVREWMILSLSQAPCTSQGLLQEKLCKANAWQKSQPTAEVVSLLSEIKIGTGKNDHWTGTKTANIPAVMAAAAAASGAKLNLRESFNFEVLSTCMISATAKSNHAGEIAGMRSLYGSFGSLDPPASGPGDMVEHLQPKTGSFSEVLLKKFVRRLQEFINDSERGREVDKSSFHETCSQATALLLSDLGSDSKSNVESFSKLLRLLCWSPAHILTSNAMETGVFIWTWLVSAAPQLCSLVLAELVDAWLSTVDTKRGLFASEVRCCGPGAKLRPHLGPGEPEAPPEKDPVEQIMAHRLWLGFFIDRFEMIISVVQHDSVSQLLLLGRLLRGTIKLPWNFSSHPAATGTFITLMLLGLKFCSCKLQGSLQNVMAGFQLLEDRIYRASLGWFAHQPEWYDMNKSFALSEVQSVSMFVHHLLNEQLDSSQLDFKGRALVNGISLNDVKNQHHPVWGQMEGYAVGREKRKQLLLMLCQHEADRLNVWAQPTANIRESTSRLKISSEKWVDFARTAFSVDPRIAFCLAARFPTNNHLKAEVTQLVQLHILEIRHIPEALSYFVTPKATDENSTLLQQLPHWAACSITQALEFLTPAYKGHPRVMAYVLRVLESYPPQRVTFFMPQLVQALRYDGEKLVEGYLLRATQRSHIFAHILIWNLQGETCEPESGKDSSATHAAFLALLPLVRQRIIDGFSEKARDVFQREFDFFNKVTSISGALYQLPKEERRAGIRRELEKIEMQGDDLYLPTAPNKIVKGIQVDSGIPLQSAAKVPIMITFNVADRDGDQNDIKPQACIFKVGDDCRQDVLALQVISLLKDIFEAVGLNLYLYPYGVLPTGPERGIIEVVPNSRSRSQMGETADGGLYEIFQQDFGPVGSPGFEAARENFIISSAGYAVASVLLQPKDRHNGNLLIDSAGRLVHIDFGFILEISPGRNMGFESAHFKLSHEMTQLIDPSGAMKSETWYQFVSLCVKGYLAARRYMDGIISTVSMMVDSGLPCFSRGDPIGNLQKRFHPEMSEREAANYMIRACSDAYNKWTTAGYDLIQYMQQGIEK